MAAYLIALVKIKDAGKMAEYAAAAFPTIVAAQGTVVGHGTLKQTLAGNFDADNGLIVRFPTAAAAHNWYHSAAYQALIPLRDQASSLNLLVLEEPI